MPLGLAISWANAQLAARFYIGHREFNEDPHSMNNNRRPFVRLNAQLVQYHKEELREQIASLKEQIEANLEKKESIKHLKNLIFERELHLNEYPDVARPAAPLSAKRPKPGWGYDRNGRTE